MHSFLLIKYFLETKLCIRFILTSYILSCHPMMHVYTLKIVIMKSLNLLLMYILLSDHVHFWLKFRPFPTYRACHAGYRSLCACIIYVNALSKNEELNTLEYWKLPEKHENAIKTYYVPFYEVPEIFKTVNYLYLLKHIFYLFSILGGQVDKACLIPRFYCVHIYICSLTHVPGAQAWAGPRAPPLPTFICYI